MQGSIGSTIFFLLTSLTLLQLPKTQRGALHWLFSSFSSSLVRRPFRSVFRTLSLFKIECFFPTYPATLYRNSLHSSSPLNKPNVGSASEGAGAGTGLVNTVVALFYHISAATSF